MKAQGVFPGGWRRASRIIGGTAAAAAVLLTALAAVPASAGTDVTSGSADVSHAQIVGSGSSWSANAINQWIADVTANGLQVVFTANGSASGRKDYANRTTDFAVSDIGFQGTDPATQTDDSAQGRPYAYLPVVAGGTAFPYHLEVAGQLVRNLRLSGQTLSKIFTNQITMWNDPAITKDNNGISFPAIPIIPVVHSEGSGSSAQFSAYLAKQYSSDWTAFNNGSDTLTEYFPHKGQAVAQSGSDGVMNYIASSAANGAIGFDEYSYALGKNYPVAKVENSAGFYNLPTQYNVAVALTQALINTDTTSPNYLLQDLHQVYVDSDPRTYPLSSYSYMIIPTGNGTAEPNETTAKRQTIADYLYYSICQGQKEMGPIGYSPLPINLVSAGFDQIAQLKNADPNVDLTNESVASCSNPTFVAGNPSANYLAQIAPQPPTCDQDGQGPCGGPGDTGTVNPPSSGTATKTGNSTSGTTSKTASKTTTTATKGAATKTAAGAARSAAGSGASAVTAPGAAVNAAGSTASGAGAATAGQAASATTGASTTTAAAGTGAADGSGAAVAGAGDQASVTTGTSANDVAEVPTSSTELAASQGTSLTSTLGAVAVLLLLAIVLLPPFLVKRLHRSRQGVS